MERLESKTGALLTSDAKTEQTVVLPNNFGKLTVFPFHVAKKHKLTFSPLTGKKLEYADLNITKKIQEINSKYRRHKLVFSYEHTRILMTVSYGNVNTDVEVTYPQMIILSKLGETYTDKNVGLPLSSFPKEFISHAAGLVIASIIDKYLYLEKGETYLNFSPIGPYQREPKSIIKIYPDKNINKIFPLYKWK
jgi:hypothetical protein